MVLSFAENILRGEGCLLRFAAKRDFQENGTFHFKAVARVDLTRSGWDSPSKRRRKLGSWSNTWEKIFTLCFSSILRPKIYLTELTFASLKVKAFESKTERFLMALQDDVSEVLLFRTIILKEEIPSISCKACGDHLETVINIYYQSASSMPSLCTSPDTIPLYAHFITICGILTKWIPSRIAVRLSRDIKCVMENERGQI